MQGGTKNSSIGHKPGDNSSGDQTSTRGQTSTGGQATTGGQLTTGGHEPGPRLATGLENRDKHQNGFKQGPSLFSDYLPKRTRNILKQIKHTRQKSLNIEKPSTIGFLSYRCTKSIIPFYSDLVYNKTLQVRKSTPTQECLPFNILSNIKSEQKVIRK